MTIVERTRVIMDHPIAQHPTVRKITGYSAGSVVALATSTLAYALTFGLHGGTVLASLFGFVGGAVPNYILNRRWAWRDHRGRSRRSEITLYMAVALSSFGSSILVTSYAERVARHLTHSADGKVALVTLAFVGVSGVFFIVKYVIYDLLVFKQQPRVALSD
jgi:putative flippase GtrA